MISVFGYMIINNSIGRRIRDRRGVTLIEMMAYVGIVAVVGLIMMNFVIAIADVYGRLRAEREVLANGRQAIETLRYAVSHAEGVYRPTSNFNADTSQLSLVTSIGAQSEHTTNYIDYWLDDGALLVKTEGVATSSVTARTVRVTRFKTEHLLQGIGRQAVKITLELESANPKFPTSVTLESTTAMRGNY